MNDPAERLRWLRETHDVGIPLDVAIGAAPLVDGLRGTYRVRQSCSWCDEMVTLNPDGSPVFCSSCGHRGDVARMHCDCQRCRRPIGTVSQ